VTPSIRPGKLVRNGVCVLCGSAVLNGDHLRDDLPPCYGRFPQALDDVLDALEAANRERERCRNHLEHLASDVEERVRRIARHGLAPLPGSSDIRPGNRGEA
jgi:hypothetical protein